MRRNDDRRPARRTKLDILRRLGRTGQVRMLVDDDELVCEAAEVADLPWCGPAGPIHRLSWRTPRSVRAYLIRCFVEPKAHLQADLIVRDSAIFDMAASMD